MHNDGFIVRAIVTIIDDRPIALETHRARKNHFEVEVLPGEDLYAKLHELMAKAAARTQQDVAGSRMAPRVAEVKNALASLQAGVRVEVRQIWKSVTTGVLYRVGSKTGGFITMYMWDAKNKRDVPCRHLDTTVAELLKEDRWTLHKDVQAEPVPDGEAAGAPPC